MDKDFTFKILKSADPEVLIVPHAASTEDQIRFYINNELFVYACQTESGPKTDIDCISPIEKKSIFTFIKENKKEILLMFGTVVVFLAFIVSMVEIVLHQFNSMLLCLLIINVVTFIINITATVLSELKNVPASLKSKHSAEHMMVNFLETNTRLPKNIEELKGYSRFSVDCGSRKKIDVAANSLIQGIIALGIAIIIQSIVNNTIKDEIIASSIIAGMYLLTYWMVLLIIKKTNILNFVTAPLKSALNRLTQMANTTSKVSDEDLGLACKAAEWWLLIVYPEFYNN